MKNKTTKALLINAVNATIQEIEITAKESFATVIGCDRIELIDKFKNNDSLYVDEEGWYNNYNCGFIYRGKKFLGNGLISGVTKSGDSCNVKTKEEDIEIEFFFTL